MADFSQAIANGFNIAIGMREQRMREEGQRLDESYRRDVFNENRRQFGLDDDFRKRVQKRSEYEYDTDNTYRNNVFNYQKEQDKVTNRQNDERIDIARGSLRLDQDKFAEVKRLAQQERDDALAAGAVGLWADARINGASAEEAWGGALGALLKDDNTRKEASLVISGGKDPNLFEQASGGGGSLHLPVFGPDGAVMVGVGKDGKPTWMTEGRTPGTDGKPAKIPSEVLTSLVFAAAMKSPAAMAQFRRYLGAKGLMTPEEIQAGDSGKVDDKDKVLKLVTESEVQSSQNAPASTQTPPAAGGASGSWGAAPAAGLAQPPAPLTWGEAQGQAARRSVVANLAPAAAVLDAGLVSGKRAYGDIVGGVVDFTSGLLGAAPRASTQSAPPAGGQPNTGGASGSWDASPPSQQPSGQSPAAGLAGNPRVSARDQAVRDMWNQQNAFGLEYTPSDVAAGLRYGIPSGQLTQTMLEQQDKVGRYNNELMMKAAKNRSELLGLYIRQGTGKNDPFGPQRMEMANGDAELVARIIGEKHFAINSPLADSTMKQVAQIVRRSEVRDDYGEMLRGNPELRAATAIAATNPAVGSVDDMAESVARIAQLSNTKALSVGKMAALIELDRQAAIEQWSPEQLAQAQKDIMSSEK